MKSSFKVVWLNIKSINKIHNLHKIEKLFCAIFIIIIGNCNLKKKTGVCLRSLIAIQLGYWDLR